VRMALRRERVRFTGETIELPLPDGPGKALKLTIAPVQERIPVYIAAIGPKNTTLTAEIADGWIPTLFSPEHVTGFRPLLEEGFARAGDGKSFADFDIAPTVQTLISDDRAAARDAMRPYLALYVGGMGSRKQNFYNALVRRYGFEDAAQRVQDLYLEGHKEEAAAALPGELIDAVSLCGPADVVRERLAMFRDAGVGTLMVSPMSWSFEDRRRQLRLVADLAG
jgi:F420-dependent oxidoreductase-like protein